MRIITGSARGCRLKTPQGQAVTRPTADRVKESLFNILGQMVVGRKVLDIFAGTGNLGLEALSRGAAKATLVDKATGQLLLANARLTKLSDKVTVANRDVFSEMSRLEQQQSEFELIFCDPPYKQGLWEKALLQIDRSNGLLAKNGILVIEHGAAENEIPPLAALELVMNRRYGHTTQLSFFQWRSYRQEVNDD